MARRKHPLARIATQPGLSEQLLEAGLGSAFEIARGGVEALLTRVPGLDGEAARSLHQRATALAVLAARHYREQRLVSSGAPSSAPWRTGLRALVDGPTFENQFSPNWGDNCLPGAIEATTSPAAYLTALFQWATTVIEPQANTEEDTPVFLAARRPDLASLVLDNQSLERVEPTIGIVNEILESAARKHLDDHNQTTLTVDDALLEARYPMRLPFERYMSQINAILRRKDYSLGDLVRQLDPDFPYFCRGGLHSLRSDEALQLDMAIGPEQRALLLEAAYFPRGARRTSARSVQVRVNPRSGLRESLHALQSGFYQRHYGVENADALLPLSAFCLRTGLNQDGVESLLSIERHAPVASPNVPGLAAPTPARFGSVYINAGEEPTLGIVSDGADHKLSDAVADHFDRVQRMVRLAQWLDLPFGEVDALVDAALQAEHGEAGHGREISENTLRALGLFQRLRRDYKVRAEDFAALLHGVGLYARGDALTQFDRVFNDPALFSEPLVLDDSPFTIVPANDAEYHKIHHLCGALGLSFETYLYLARYIAQAGAPQPGGADTGERLYWSPAVVSAFYRLARLPAWLGLSSVEVLALLQLMGERGHQYVARLVTTTLTPYQHTELADTLGVVQALADTVQWLRENDLEVAWLYQHLMPLAPVAAASDRELDLLREIGGRMAPAILTESSFRDAGLPMIAGVDLPRPIDWLKQLDPFVSPQGLILDHQQDPDNEAYELALHTHLERVVSDLELPDGPHVLVRVFQLVMEARSAQRSLVWESLANLFGGSAELSQELLGWAGGTSVQLLQEVLRLFDGSDLLPIPVGDEVLTLLARLTQRMGIVEQLGLSPLALRYWWQHHAWFEDVPAEGVASKDITFAHLHVLVQYRHLLEFTRQAEQGLLDYLKLVNSLPPDLSDDDLRLIREDAAGKIAQFTGFGIRDILETALEITVNGLICTVRQLDHLVRVRLACQTLQLGSSAAITLGRLRGNSSREEYRAAAEGALSSLTALLDQQVTADRGELGQSETSWIVVDTQRLVARTDEKARCLLTIKNFLGEPLANITVTWETSLSRLGSPSSDTTDANGQVGIDLEAGEDMGTAQVIARFGLGRQILAPLVVIDCDLVSLSISDPLHEPEEALAGNLQVIEYRLQVKDRHENPGRDQVVQWSTDLGNFERPQTRTDADGFATARLRSLSSGVATVAAVLPVNGEEQAFDPVTFLEQQYFQYVRFSGPVAATQPATATCRVVNLDGSPQRNVTVLWSADLGGFVEENARSITDNDGVAVITYLSPEPGEVTLTINARFDNKDLQPLSSERVTVHLLPSLVDMEPAEQFYILQQARPAEFQVRLDPPAAGYPVTWWDAEALLATTYTSADGMARYQRHFTSEQLGERSVTVRSLREDEAFDFKVQVVLPHTHLIAQVGPNNPGIVLEDAARVIFAVDPGMSSELLIFARRDGDLGDDEARLTITLDDFADPDALGVVFDPPLGEILNCDAEGKVTLKIDCTNAAFLPNSDPSNNHMRLRVTSNLGTTLLIWVGLRYLLDLEKSELHFFRGPTSAALSGRLRRRNGNVAPSLRDGHRTLRLALEGAQEPMDVELFADAGDVLWLHAPSFAGQSGQIGSSCTFEALGDLKKRVCFAGSAVFEAQRIISNATLSIAPVADPSLVVDGTAFYADHGDSYRFEFTLSDPDGPIVGVPLLAVNTLVNGVEYQGGGPTDDDGQTWLDVDARRAVLGVTHSLPVDLGPLSRTLDLQVCVLIALEVDLRLVGGIIEVTVAGTRLEGRLFAEDTCSFSITVGTTSWNRLVSLKGEGFTFSAKVDGNSASIVQIRIPTPNKPRYYLVGQTSFPVEGQDLAPGEAS
ncbi:MAG: Ig-like domain-containing protein [Paucimonas sp.]|nr:Ig-like domain-containing protein [Paucimonas sp.]